VPIGACAGSVPNATVPLETGRPAAGMNSTCDGSPLADGCPRPRGPHEVQQGTHS
jgi:hypothetical protein